MEDWTEFVTPDMLAERVTLDHYLAKLLAPLSRPPELSKGPQEVIQENKPPLEALTKPGDEWWEWITGTEPLMQSGGLALVRKGVVVWARMDWIS